VHRLFTRLPAIAEQALKAGNYKIVPLFPKDKTLLITEAEVRRFAFPAEMFENLNTPEDLDRARSVRPERIYESSSHHSEPEQTGPYAEFQHVSKAFGDHKVLEDVSFKVFPGETLCILGRSGVGKSVSLHHIMGFLKPDSGRVVVAFHDITDATEAQLERVRKKVTMVFQNGALFDSLTVGENVLSLCANDMTWMKNRSIRSWTACWTWWA